jgi:hypothetical protein
MTVYTTEDAQRNLDTLLDEARTQGEVRIKRPNGEEFSLRAVHDVARTDTPQDQTTRRRDLTDLAGTWVEDPAFDQAIADQDVVDEDLWK